jgi:hypothetical protein
MDDSVRLMERQLLTAKARIGQAPYVIVRGKDSGVFAGDLISREGDHGVTLANCRRLWRWFGAASISEIGLTGVKTPQECKFTVSIAKHEILDVIEIIYATEDAKASIAGVAIWKA